MGEKWFALALLCFLGVPLVVAVVHAATAKPRPAALDLAHPLGPLILPGHADKTSRSQP